MTTTESTISIKTIVVDLSREKDSIHHKPSSSRGGQKNQQQLIQKIQATIQNHGATSASPIIMSGGISNDDSNTSMSFNPLGVNVLKNDEKVRKSLTEAILKFLQPKDKITQLTSTLLKSWVYHFYLQSYSNNNVDQFEKNHRKKIDSTASDTDIEDMMSSDDYSAGVNVTASARRSTNTNRGSVPIAVLPRTKFKKPYIQLEFRKKNKINGDNGGNDDDDNDYEGENDDNNRLDSSSYCCCKSVKQRQDLTDSTSSLFLPFSISHQYPIIALSFMSIEPHHLSSFYHSSIADSGNNTHEQSSGNEQHPNQSLRYEQPKQSEEQKKEQQLEEKIALPLLGMDVVTFDNPTNRMSIQDFIQIYKESFTRWEWEQIMMVYNTNANSNEISASHTYESYYTYINNYLRCSPSSSSSNSIFFNSRSHQQGNNVGELSDEAKMEQERQVLIEFYLRWSMKEAYTKALGLGLGVDFQSFESHLVGFDDDIMDTSTSTNGAGNSKRSIGLWDYILHQCETSKGTQDIVYFPAHTYHLDEDGQQKECDDSWKFYFLPLYQEFSVDEGRNDDDVNNDSENNEDNTIIIGTVLNEDDGKIHTLTKTKAIFGCSCICVQTSNENNIMRDKDSPAEMQNRCTRSSMSIQDLSNFHHVHK